MCYDRSHVRFGHEGAAGAEDLSDCFGEITADVAAGKSEVLDLSLHYQEISAKQTLDSGNRTAASGCGFNRSLQHAKLIMMRRSVVHEIPKEDLLHRN